jgi:tRNA/tmRNA/rRNA uracil-C5-methylase (TrmA/RlmC/RlmD family)
MLDLAEIRADDVLADLGSGDGRIPIAAATIYGIRACGCELRPDLVAAARKNAEAAGVAHLVKFLQRDLFELDLAEASVVTLYLLTPVNVALRPTLLRRLAARQPDRLLLFPHGHLGAGDHRARGREKHLSLDDPASGRRASRRR